MMGRPIEPVEPGQRVTVPAYLLDRPGVGDYYVLRVVGDSMNPEHILDGDYAVIERREEARPGEAVVVLVADEATIKRYYPDGSHIRLQPMDPTLKPIRVPVAEVRIQGVIVGLMRKY